MPNYYELLNVPTSATTAEIQAAFEQQYNQWRRLVTHHDPKIVNQANQAIQSLEIIRTTLTDSVKRAGYDAGIGLSSISGLADPEAILRTSMQLPHTRSDVAPRQESLQRVDAWICSQCSTANAVGTRFCKQCGNKIGDECPKCGKLIEAAAKFCAICGANVSELRPQFEKQWKLSERITYWQSFIRDRFRETSRGEMVVKFFLAQGAIADIYRVLANLLNQFQFGSRTFVAKSMDGNNGYISAEGSGFLISSVQVHIFLDSSVPMGEEKIVAFCCFYPYRGTTDINLQESTINALCDGMSRQLRIRAIN